MYKLSQLAERLNCSVQNLYDAIARGDLEAYSIGANGKGYRCSEEQVKAFLESRRVHRGKDALLFSVKCSPVKLKHLK